MLLLSTTGLLAGDEASVRRRAQPAFPDDVRVERGVPFLAPHRKERADLYFPVGATRGQRVPAVVLIHGGGWVGGRRDAARELNIGSTLARNGYLAMSIDYQVSDRKQAVWPTNLWDCKTAIRWLRVAADRLGVDAGRIGVLGGSAGGHLAAMVALTGPDDGLEPPEPYAGVSTTVRCCVNLYGIADIGKYHDVTMLGKTFAEDPELYRRASPVTYVRSNSAPFLILHGTADTTVKVEQSELLAATLAQHGVPHELVLIPGAPHTFHLQPKERDLRPVVLEFLDRHLRGRAGTARGRDQP